MALNRFDKYVPKDYSWETPILKLPELDVAGFDEVLKQQQTQIDQVGMLSDKKPNVLNNQPDMELYQQYKQDVDLALDNVSKEYGKGITAGQMAYKNYLNQFRKDWSPGGRADILNKRTEAYQSGIKAIDDFYKDDSSPVNKTLAKKQLQEQLKNPLKVDPVTGQFTNFSQPELYKDPNINKAVDEMLKEIKANGDTSFLGDENKSWWLKKIQTETREPERIKLAYQALSAQPQYASQIDRDTQYKALTIDPVKYQANFEANQKGFVEQLDKEAARISEKGTKQEIINWQNQLRAEGFNVKPDGDWGPLTEKASKEFLTKQKETVNQNIAGFDLNKQLRGEVDKSYLGYALRGAYSKVDIDPYFNQAKKAVMDFSLKKEENSINMWRAQMEFAPKDQASTTAVSGVAQQLPEIQTYHKDLKAQLSEVEKNVDKGLANSKTFAGWTKANVAEAYNTWNKVTGNTPEERKANYKALLAQKSDYPFTDQQIDEIFKEMNGAGDGVIKTSLKNLGQLQSEVNRIEEGNSNINSQYLTTEEGKQSLKNLDFFRQPGETDVQLANRALNNPETFVSKVPYADKLGKDQNPLNWFKDSKDKENGFNPAKQFAERRAEDIKRQQKNGIKYNWGSLGTVEVYANSDDKVLKPTLDGIAQALETGTGLNFSSFGQAGLVYKNKDGEEVDAGKSRKVVNMAPTVGLKGQPVIRVGMSISGERGGSYAAFTDIDVVPGSVEQIQLMTGMKKAYVEKLKNEGAVAAQPYLDIVEALQGKDGMDRAAIDIQVKDLNLNNTSDNKIYTTEYHPVTGEPMLVDVTKYGWKSKNLEKDENIGGYGYELWGFSTPTNNVVGNVFIDANGNRILSPAVGQPGAFTFNSSDAALKDRQGKYILSETPVEVKETKVNRSGQSTKTTEITKTTKSE